MQIAEKIPNVSKNYSSRGFEKNRPHLHWFFWGMHFTSYEKQYELKSFFFLPKIGKNQSFHIHLPRMRTE